MHSQSLTTALRFLFGLFVALPFIKHPETNDVFAIFFTKAWQDALPLSLFNYISIVFQSMPVPSLLDVVKPADSSHKVSIKYVIV